MSTATHCPYCARQCGITLSINPPGQPAGLPTVALVPQEEFPTNRGGLCAKGWTAAELLDSQERLTTPPVRDSPGASLRPTTWDDALDRVAAAIRRSQDRSGADSVGCFGGGGLTNEKAYRLGKFAWVALRSSAIDDNGRFCMSSAAVADNRGFGVDRGMPSSIRGAPPPARGSHLHLQPVPGTDLALANGLLHLAIRDGYVDTDYVDARTPGFDTVRRSVRAYWPDRVERVTGVPVAALEETVRLLGKAGSAMILMARVRSSAAAEPRPRRPLSTWRSAAACPDAGTRASQRSPARATATAVGKTGRKPISCPSIADSTIRPPARMSPRGGGAPEELPSPGRSAYEMLDQLGTDGGVRVLLVLASNIAVSASHSTHIAEQGVFWPCPDETQRGRPGSSPTASPPRTAGRGSPGCPRA